MTSAATAPSSTKSLLSSYNEKDTVEVWRHNREQGRCSFRPQGSSSPVSKTDQKQEKKKKATREGKTNAVHALEKKAEMLCLGKYHSEEGTRA